uniref:Rieske domain-containing protein n=1 Tax=Aegilops tauschii subsp. strangulata TaxID=200361 RepID=A0A453EJ69_AEGTS
RRGWRRGCVDGKLECLYHGWQFDGQGKCVKIPQVNGAMMWWYNISAAVLQAAFHVEDRVQGRGVSDIVHILLSLFVKLVCTLCNNQAIISPIVHTCAVLLCNQLM